MLTEMKRGRSRHDALVESLRVNAQRGNRDRYLAKLAEVGIAANPGSLCEQTIQLQQPRDVLELPGFTAGEASVQDEAAQMAAILLQPQPGERVLDACAAPGGKTCHVLEIQPELGQLVAMDVDELRLQKVEENLQRLGLGASLLVRCVGPKAGEVASMSSILCCASAGKLPRPRCPQDSALRHRCAGRSTGWPV